VKSSALLYKNGWEPLRASPFIFVDEESQRFFHIRAVQLAEAVAIGTISLVAMVS
jgi:hypothetical protein